MNRKGSFEPAAVKGRGRPIDRLRRSGERGHSDLMAGGAVYRTRGRRSSQRARLWRACRSPWPGPQADFDGDGRTDLAGGHARGQNPASQKPDRDRRTIGSGSASPASRARSSRRGRSRGEGGTALPEAVLRGRAAAVWPGALCRVDTVRISWPNGLIQNERNQPAGRTAVYKEAPSLSGSCPMVFAWNGREFEFLADVLGVAPLGASSGDGGYFPVDHDEYLQIPAESLDPRDGRYEIRITEELHEVSYIDQVRLIALDHPARSRSSPTRSSSRRRSPSSGSSASAGASSRRRVDGRGRDVLPRLLRRDRVYADGFRHDMAGVAEMHSLELDFGPRAAPDNRRC